MAVLRIPERDKPVLRALIKLSDDEFTALLAHLSSLPPSQSMEAFSEQIKLDIPSISAQDLVTTLVSVGINSSHSPASREQFFKDLQISWDKLKEEKSEDDSDRLVSRLSALLEPGAPFVTTLKTDVLKSEYPNIFRSSRLFTDIRPVFSDIAVGNPSNFTVSHTLKINYAGQEDNIELYITLDKDDLLSLQELIARALAKAEVVENLIQKLREASE